MCVIVMYYQCLVLILIVPEWPASVLSCQRREKVIHTVCQIIPKPLPVRAVGTPTSTLELYKKYISCLCAVCITCIVLTISLLIHLLRDTSSESFSVLRSQVLNVKDGDLSSCYTQERYSRRTNKSKEPALILTKLIEEKNFLKAVDCPG